MCIYCAGTGSHQGYFHSGGNAAVAAGKMGPAGKYGKSIYYQDVAIQHVNGGVSVQQASHGVVYNTGDVYIDALANWTWNSTIGQAVTLSFNFSLYHGGNYTPSEFSAADKDWARLATTAAERVANITFSEISSNGAQFADVPISGADIPGGTAGLTYIHSSNGITSWAPIQIDELYLPMVPGTLGFSFMLHELGHALGLKHPFDGTPQLPSGQESMDLTVMTYSPGNFVQREDPTGYQYADVKALQFLYGVGSHNAGNTTYVFSERMAETIVDTGGNDTIYLGDSFNTGATLNLGNGGPVAGHWNIVTHNNGQVSKVNFSSTTTIENAIGGLGHDAIDGNDAANYLYGHGGSDTIRGKGGNDIILGGRSVADANDGFDSLLGGDGADMLYGNSGNDTLIGGNGTTDPTSNSDTLYGGSGNDILYGNGGNDWLIGGPGQDTIYGGLGEDRILEGWSGPGNGPNVDIIIGFEGAGVAGGDQLRVVPGINGSGIATLADLRARAVDDGWHTWISFTDAQGNGSAALILWHTVNDFDWANNGNDFFITANLFA